MNENVKMPFGKHRGAFIRDVPSNYLRWALRECDNLDPQLRLEITSELDSRGEAEPGARRRRPQRQEPRQIEHAGAAAWRKCWRRMIFLAHPDRGGDEELCKILNGLNDLMQA